MAEKYVLEKEGKASVRTDSESVKYRYLADGFTLKGKPAAPSTPDSSKK